jgi:hypothetical protein
MGLRRALGVTPAVTFVLAICEMAFVLHKIPPDAFRAWAFEGALTGAFFALLMLVGYWYMFRTKVPLNEDRRSLSCFGASITLLTWMAFITIESGVSLSAKTSLPTSKTFLQSFGFSGLVLVFLCMYLWTFFLLKKTAVDRDWRGRFAIHKSSAE